MIRTLMLASSMMLLAACGGSKKNMPFAAPSNLLLDVAPAVAEGPYAGVLKSCAIAQTAAESCTLNTLPVLGMDTPAPSVDDIMERVLVSHPWMAQRFRALLEIMPEDIHLLMRGVTAVVIDADIRPSYQYILTGAIYLDPEYLWLNEEEQAVINKAPDYRAGFDDPMAFRSVWRYVDGATDAFAGLRGPVRELTGLVPPLAALLFHELAHANDALPPTAYDSVDTSQSILDVTYNRRAESTPSTLLSAQQGLQSAIMKRIAEILYRGEPSTAEERQMTAAQTGAFFAEDVANDDYAYSSQFEDLAMLFEEAMMKIHFDIDRDAAFTAVPAAGSGMCNDYLVGWGMRNRVAAANIAPRALWVIQQLLPERNYTTAFSELPAPRFLPVNVGWCASIALESSQAKPLFYAPAESDTALPLYHTLRPYHYAH